MSADVLCLVGLAVIITLLIQRNHEIAMRRGICRGCGEPIRPGVDHECEVRS